MLLMIDNYDSFTYNLVQYFAELGEDVRVVRNDEITVEGIGAMRPGKLVLSPGPCSPAEAGVCIDAIRAFAGQMPILGVCLGHQAIGAALGGKVVRARAQMHGKTDVITTDERGVYHALPPRFTVTPASVHACWSTSESWGQTGSAKLICATSPSPKKVEARPRVRSKN